MKKTLFLGSLLLGTVLFIPCSNAAEIYDVATYPPASTNNGPPGSYLQINGMDLLPSTDAKHLVMVFTRGEVTVSPRPFVMDLDVISWSDAMIVARIPGLDSNAFREAPYGGPYDSTGLLPAETINYFNGHSVMGFVEILVEEAGTVRNYGNSKQFTISPSTDTPIIHRLSTTIRHAGDGLQLFGSNFGTAMGEVVFVSSGGAETVISPPSWQTTELSFRIPDTMEAGTYSIFIRRMNNARTAAIESNRKGVSIEAEVPPISITVARGLALEATFVQPEAPVCDVLEAPPAESTSGAIMTSISGLVCPFYVRTEFTNIYPNSGPPGTFVELDGRCLGNSQSDRFITLSSPQIEGGRMDADIVSWSNGKVIIRIPGPEKFFTSSTGEEYLELDSRGVQRLYYDLAGRTMSVRIELRKGTGVLSAAEFTLVPYNPSSSPVICSVKPSTLAIGDCIKIFGGGFGFVTAAHRIFTEKDGIMTPITGTGAPVWTSTMVNACTRRGIETGAYKLYIYSATTAGGVEDHVSNKVDLNIMQKFEAATGVRATMPENKPSVIFAPAPQNMQIYKPSAPSNIEVVPGSTSTYSPVSPGSGSDKDKDKNNSGSGNTLFPSNSDPDKKKK